MWRFDWFADAEGEPGAKRWMRCGLIASEALTRASVTDAPGEHEALVELFDVIERGALDGQAEGPFVPEKEADDG